MSTDAMERTTDRLPQPVVIPAGEEPGALESVARLAAGWFARYLGSGRPASAAASRLSHA